MLCLYGFKKTFSFLNTRSREASISCCFASVARDLFTHIANKDIALKKKKRKRKRIKFIISFSNIIQKKLSYHLRSTPNYVFFHGLELIWKKFNLLAVVKPRTKFSCICRLLFISPGKFKFFFYCN